MFLPWDIRHLTWLPVDQSVALFHISLGPEQPSEKAPKRESHVIFQLQFSAIFKSGVATLLLLSYTTENFVFGTNIFTGQVCILHQVSITCWGKFWYRFCPFKMFLLYFLDLVHGLVTEPVLIWCSCMSDRAHLKAQIIRSKLKRLWVLSMSV